MTDQKAEQMKLRYQSIKQTMKTKNGFEGKTLHHNLNDVVENIRSQKKLVKGIGIFSLILSFPLMIVLIGFIVFPFSIVCLVFASKLSKQANTLETLIVDDPEFANL